MGKITDQLCDSIREWCQQTGEPDIGIIGVIMLGIGGMNHTFPEDADEPLTNDNVRRNFTMDRMRRYFEHLRTELYFHETIIITSAIHTVADQFHNTYELREDKQQWFAEQIEKARLLASPEFKEQILAQLEEERQFNSLIGESESDEPWTEEAIHREIANIERMAKNKMEQDLAALERLRVWRSVTSHIVEPRNWSESRQLDYEM